MRRRPPRSTLFPCTTLFRSRVFAGFAGWSNGQLESELGRDDWFVEPARADDVFTPDPEALWSEVLERKDRKSTRLNSSHANISYAVLCLKKKICKIEKKHS